MSKLIIEGGKRLSGSVAVSGSGRSALALLSAAVLSEQPSILEQVPHITDVTETIHNLRMRGVRIEGDGRALTVDASRLAGAGEEPIPFSCLAAALLAREGEALFLPQEDGREGTRMPDFLLKGFRALGANLIEEGRLFRLVAPKLSGTRIYLDEARFDATVALMLAAARANGVTVLENVARDPEVVDVATFLTSMGVHVKGAGTDVIRIYGTGCPNGTRHAVLPDRFEAGFWMIAAAATGGRVRVMQVIPEHLQSVSAKLRETGAAVAEEEEAVTVEGSTTVFPVDVKSLPYPGYPSALQHSFATLLTQASGTSLVTDRMFSSRMRHVDELKKMGAKIKAEGRTAIVQGPVKLHGATVSARDVPSALALVIAALVAKGKTEIFGAEELDRGVEEIASKLVSLGAVVKWG
jgi:UDP-N-acetylglucosamine 1-carboxyvinyltransferase